MQNTEQEYLQAIISTLKSLLASDKALIDAGQKQLEVLQTRSGIEFIFRKFFTIKNNFFI